MADNTLMRMLVLLAFAAVSCAAQDSAPPLVNLGRLSIARLSAGDCDGSPDSGNRFYGSANAFDGGRHMVDGFNCSTWYSCPESFVVVRFTQPVTVTGIVVEGSSVASMPSPDSFTVHIRPAPPGAIVVSPAIGGAGLAIYAPPRPVEDVREVVLFFQSKLRFGVDEIEILGPPPAGVDLSPVNPLRDPAPARRAPGDTAAEGAARKALIRTLAGMEIAKMRAARAAADRAPDSARQASAWFEMNRAADRLSDLIVGERDLRSFAEQATALGVTVEWCEPGGEWSTRTQGYEKYLQLWPNGPQADEAWWMGRVPNGPRCGDYEGTPEEDAELDRQYSEFLKRFPTSMHALEAEQRKAVKPK